MARGDKKTYNQQEQQAFANANQAAQQGYANQQAAFGPAYQGYAAELSNPGYTPEEEQAMRQATAGSLAGAFGAAATRLRNQASRTGNTAGENATEEQLGREQGQQAAQAEGALEGQFGQARIQGMQNAAAGMGDLYRDASSAAASGLGAANGLVGTQSRVALQPGFWSQVLQGALARRGF